MTCGGPGSRPDCMRSSKRDFDHLPVSRAWKVDCPDNITRSLRTVRFQRIQLLRVPAPIAIPTSAVAKAGASFTPPQPSRRFLPPLKALYSGSLIGGENLRRDLIIPIRLHPNRQRPRISGDHRDPDTKLVSSATLHNRGNSQRDRYSVHGNKDPPSVRRLSYQTQCQSLAACHLLLILNLPEKERYGGGPKASAICFFSVRRW